MWVSKLRPNFDQTSTNLRPNFDQTSTKLRPNFDTGGLIDDVRNNQTIVNVSLNSSMCLHNIIY